MISGAGGAPAGASQGGGGSISIDGASWGSDGAGAGRASPTGASTAGGSSKIEAAAFKVAASEDRPARQTRRAGRRARGRGQHWPPWAVAQARPRQPGTGSAPGVWGPPGAPVASGARPPRAAPARGSGRPPARGGPGRRPHRASPARRAHRRPPGEWAHRGRLSGVARPVEEGSQGPPPPFARRSRAWPPGPTPCFRSGDPRAPGQRLLVARHRGTEVPQALQALGQEAARQDVVGGALEDGLELPTGAGQVPLVEERPPEGHARRWVGRVLLEALSRDERSPRRGHRPSGAPRPAERRAASPGPSPAASEGRRCAGWKPRCLRNVTVPGQMLPDLGPSRVRASVSRCAYWGQGSASQILTVLGQVLWAPLLSVTVCVTEYAPAIAVVVLDVRLVRGTASRRRTSRSTAR